MTTPIDPVERRLPDALADLAAPRTPDYFIDILGQTARVRQRPAWARPGRWFGMNGFVGRPALAAVVVVLVAVIGGGIILSQRNQASIGTPTASPSSAPSTNTPTAGPSAAAAVPPGSVPPELAARWMGPTFDLAGLGSWTRTQIVFDAGFAYVSGTNVGSYLTSSVDAGQGTMKLTLKDDEVGCHAGDVGDYTWSLAPAGSTLTLKVVSDPCKTRATAFNAEWFREGCKNTDDGCFGVLDAGPHPSQYFTPRRAVGGEWVPTWGALTYTVPAGWANSQDWPNEFSLTPFVDYAKETAAGPAEGASHEIWVVTHPSANKLTPDCGPTIDTKVPSTVDGLFTWISNEPGLVTSGAVPITVDGHPGKWMDVRLMPSWKTTCPNGTGQPERPLFAYPSQTDANAWTASIAGAERYRVILIDLDGQTVGILIDSSDPTRFDELVGQAMPIIQSFKFQ